MDVTAKILQLENDLRQLIKRWDRFFVGDLRVPPIPDKELMGRQLRMLADRQPRRSGDVFRLKQLQHRYMAYSTNWERMLREHEEGVRRYVPGRSGMASRLRRGPEAPIRRPPANEPPSASVEDDRAPDLYDLWKNAREGLGHEVKTDRATFEGQIEGQRQQIEQKLGHTVKFDVRVVDDRVKLVVRRMADAEVGE
jgi:hypothetical protein